LWRPTPEKFFAHAHPSDAAAASQSQQGQHKMKETVMRKFLAILAAVVLFAPVAYASLYQAALIVA
jgi:hypothetical protein